MIAIRPLSVTNIKEGSIRLLLESLLVIGSLEAAEVIVVLIAIVCVFCESKTKINPEDPENRNKND